MVLTRTRSESHATRATRTFMPVSSRATSQGDGGRQLSLAGSRFVVAPSSTRKVGPPTRRNATGHRQEQPS
jgi:hypothetical protein